MYSAWRVLTAGGDDAEEYLREAETLARGTDLQFQEQLEKANCSKAEYLIAEEKLSIGVTEILPAAMQRDLANYREARRRDGLPGLTGRQVLCWALRRFSRDEVRDGTSALQAMLALLDSARKASIPRSQFSS